MPENENENGEVDASRELMRGIAIAGVGIGLGTVLGNITVKKWEEWRARKTMEKQTGFSSSGNPSQFKIEKKDDRWNWVVYRKTGEIFDEGQATTESSAHMLVKHHIEDLFEEESGKHYSSSIGNYYPGKYVRKLGERIRKRGKGEE